MPEAAKVQDPFLPDEEGRELDRETTERKDYVALPTLLNFHNSPERIRGVVGPVGSGKTSGAAWDLCYYLPQFLYQEYDIKHTRWVIVRNTYRELIDTTQETVFDWFPFGHYYGKREMYSLEWPEGFNLDILFRACDQKKHIRQFKSLEVTGYWIDESIEVGGEVKLMLRNRIGRYPKMPCPKCKTTMKTLEVEGEKDEAGDPIFYYWCPNCGYDFIPSIPIKFGIETTNPPDVEHPTYSEFDWGDTPPPGPLPSEEPKKGYRGFWQPPRENVENLPIRYYEDLIEDYKDQQDWAEMYVDGKPGVIVKGKLVYNNFKRGVHVAKDPLIWSGGTLYRGWDDSGNTPACIVVQCPSPRRVQILKEFTSDKMNIEDFAKYVAHQCNMLFPNATYVDWDDPAGWNQFSKREGGFTSNAKMIQDAIGITMQPSEQNFDRRINSVDSQLSLIDGILIDPSCVRLINGFLGGYCYPEIGTTGDYKDEPIKNRFSHIHDALQYVLVKLLGGFTKPVPRRRKRRNRSGRVV